MTRFLFSDFKRKALTFSYDDNTEQDRRLVSVFRRHGLAQPLILTRAHSVKSVGLSITAFTASITGLRKRRSNSCMMGLK